MTEQPGALSEGKEIILDLSSSVDAKSLNEDQLFQREANERVCKIIDGFIEDVQTDDSEDERDDFILGDLQRVHRTIAVFGERGTGKTTFLLSLLKKYQSRPEITSLGIMDPTLVENRELPFITLLARIKTIVDAEYKERSYDNPDYSKWHSSLLRLAQGVKLFDGVSQRPYSDEWEDAEYVFEKGLKHSSGGMRVEQAFHSFLHYSTKLLDIKAFVIGFDDVDTNFTQGWPLLEMIRKYLTSKKLIVIMTGDLKLYGALVRYRQWGMFGELRDLESKDEIEGMVKHLEDQYLLKVINPDYRARLLTLYECVERKYKIRVINFSSEKGDPKQGINLDNYVTKVLEELLGTKSAIVHRSFRLFLLNEPVRTQLRLYYALEKANDHRGKMENLAVLYFNVLSRGGFRVEPLIYGDCDFVLASIGINAFQRGNSKIRSLFTLGKNTQHDRNQQVFAISTIVSSKLRSYPGSVFSFFVLMNTLIKMQNENLKAPDEAHHILAFSELEYQFNPRRLAGIANAFSVDVWSRGLKDGSIVLYSRDLRKDNIARTIRRFFGGEMKSALKALDIEKNLDLEYVKRLKSIESESELSKIICQIHDLDDVCKEKALFVRALMVNIQTRVDENRVYYSIFNLLGFISGCANCVNKEELSSFLRRNGKLQSYTEYKSVKSRDDESIRSKESDAEEQSVLDDQEASHLPDDIFLDAIFKWSQNARESLQLMVSGDLLSAIFDDFEYSLSRAEEKIAIRDYFLGSLNHRLIVAFLNSVLTLESVDQRKSSNVIVKRATTDDRVFNTNYNNSELDALPLFNFIFSCPIWLLYVKPGSSIHENMTNNLKEKGYFGDKNLSEIYKVTSGSFENLYHILNAVPLVEGVEARSQTRQNEVDSFLADCGEWFNLNPGPEGFTASVVNQIYNILKENKKTLLDNGYADFSSQKDDAKNRMSFAFYKKFLKSKIDDNRHYRNRGPRRNDLVRIMDAFFGETEDQD